MLHAKFQNHRNSCSGEEDFNGFYHIYVWRPSWSCELAHSYKLTFPLPMEAPHDFLLCLDKQFQRRSLKMVDGRRTRDGR